MRNADAIDELHGEIELAVIFAGVKNRNDIRMMQAGRDPELLFKSLSRQWRRLNIFQQLDGNASTKRALCCLVYDSHSPATDYTANMIISDLSTVFGIKTGPAICDNKHSRTIEKQQRGQDFPQLFGPSRVLFANRVDVNCCSSVGLIDKTLQ